MSKKLLTITMMILIFAFSNIMASIQSENRIKLDSEIRNLLKGNYLYKKSLLADNQYLLSVELKGKTWKNPNDTKLLVNEVMVKVRDNMPLNNEGRLFTIYIIEPMSSFPIAEIIVKNNQIEPLNYTYYKYKVEGNEKVYGSTITQNKSLPAYEVVTANRNGHTIFIYTQASQKSEFKAIVSDYRKKYETPSSKWMIQFFSDKKKALRVKQEWEVKSTENPEYYNLWVYREDVDHSGLAQWTSWDGLTIDKW